MVKKCVPDQKIVTRWEGDGARCRCRSKCSHFWRCRQGLHSVPRQGTDKRFQVGNWQSVPGRDCKRAQAGFAHWQAFPGRVCALASVPRQGTGKRSRQGQQMCPGRALANVPRQETVDVLDRELYALQKTTAQKSLATICHQLPRCQSTANPSRVLCDELACLFTGLGGYS